MTSPMLDFDYANARQLLLPTSENISLVLIGCGGTGSWLAPSVVRIARLVMDRFGKRVQVIFVDPDTVEEKNCYRQNFCPAEIGRGKAEALAFRYGLAWGVEITALAGKFQYDVISGINNCLAVLIGCVDNAAARKSIKQVCDHYSYSSSRLWWLDCGNAKSSGQVLLGSASSKPKDPYQLPGYCTWLPLPTTEHPELLEALPDEIPSDLPPMSCAEMALAGSQGLAINQRIAAEAADYLVRMFLTHDLKKRATYIDLASGTTRSKYIVSTETEGEEK
jgi:PRTRC genetic system ThiF family protein